MGFFDNIWNTRDRLRRVGLFSVFVILILALIGVAVWGFYQYKETKRYHAYLENQYQRAFQDLVGYVENIDIQLSKALLTDSPQQNIRYLSDVYRLAYSAQENLGQIPVTHLALQKTAKFLSQVGEFCYSLTREIGGGRTISPEDYNKLEKLKTYASSLNQNLSELAVDLYKGKTQWGEIRRQGSEIFQQTSKNIVAQKITDLQKEFQEYPEMVYDGAFSDHVERLKPRLLEGKREITREEAIKKVRSFLSFIDIKDIEPLADMQAAKEEIEERRKELNLEESDKAKKEKATTIQTYSFRVIPERGGDKQQITIDVTKKGGYVLWMINHRLVNKKKLSIEDAKKKALEFTRDKGLENLKVNYSMHYNNIASFVMSPVQSYNGHEVIIYPDLVKVEVALDNGEILGFESQGYVMAHKTRDIGKYVNISIDEARNSVSERFNIKSEGMAVIPLPSKKEVVCYEFKGEYKGDTYIVYINAENGNTENILLIVDTPNGTLSM